MNRLEQSLLVFKIAIIIFVVEFTVMFLLSLIPFELNLLTEASLDVVLLSLFSTPIFYYGVIKPFVIKKDNAMTEMISMKEKSDDIAAELYAAKVLLDEEREIVERVIKKMKVQSSFDHNNLRCLDIPVENLSGDVVFSAYCPDNTQHILLGDFTGHGLTSALGAPLASDVFHTMTLKGLPMADIVIEINSQMHAKMPIGLFLAAIFIEVNSERNELRIWNCGMEDVLLFRDKRLKAKIPSKNLAMGIVNQPEVVVTVIEVIKHSDRLYGYSDGITEMLNHKNEMFGQERLIQTIENMLDTNATDVQILDDSIRSYQGSCVQLDDLTLIEVLC